MPPFSQSSFDLLHLQAAANTAKLKGRQVKQVKDSRSKNTDKTTKLLIVIVALFLAAEFPQVQNINNNNVQVEFLCWDKIHRIHRKLKLAKTQRFVLFFIGL